MRSVLAVGAVLAVGLVVGAASWLLGRAPGDSSAHRDPALDRASSETSPAAAEPTAVASSPATRTAALEALRAMSETYRNTTLLIAIRDDGFVCEEVTDAVEGSDAAGWLARCRDLRVYHVGATGNGDLEAEPVPAYFDQLVPPVFNRDAPPINGPFEQLPPRRRR
jgi:hypothetical protein